MIARCVQMTSQYIISPYMKKIQGHVLIINLLRRRHKIKKMILQIED